MSVMGLLIVLASPWFAATWLLFDRRSARGRMTFVVAAVAMAVGAVLAAVSEPVTTIDLPTWFTLPGRTPVAVAWAWRADSAAWAAVAGIATIAAGSALLVPTPNDRVWTAALAVIGCLAQVWLLDGLGLLLAALSLLGLASFVLLNLDETPHDHSAAARSFWLMGVAADPLLVLAFIISAVVLHSQETSAGVDADAVGTAAMVHPGATVFVGLLLWLGALGRAAQFPLVVSIDATAAFSPAGRVFAVALGTVAAGWRLCEAAHVWWRTSVAAGDLVTAGSLVSALLAAWFGWCTRDGRVRIAYLLAANISLSLGPLLAGTPEGHAAAVVQMLVALAAAAWLWCMLEERGSMDSTEPVGSASFTWFVSTSRGGLPIVGRFPAAERPHTPRLAVPAHLAFAVGLATMLLAVAGPLAGSWWTTISTSMDTPASFSVRVAEPGPTELHPPTWAPLVGSLASVLIAMGSLEAARQVIRASFDEPKSSVSATQRSDVESAVTSDVRHTVVGSWLATGGVLFLPGLLAVGLQHREFAAVNADALVSLRWLGCALVGAIVGWLWAGLSAHQQQRWSEGLAPLARLGRYRLRVPALLMLGANRLVRGLAQVFRFLDWFVLDVLCLGTLKRLPTVGRLAVSELQATGEPSYALTLWLAVTAVVATVVWLAQNNP